MKYVLLSVELLFLFKTYTQAHTTFAWSNVFNLFSWNFSVINKIVFTTLSFLNDAEISTRLTADIHQGEWQANNRQVFSNVHKKECAERRKDKKV